MSEARAILGGLAREALRSPLLLAYCAIGVASSVLGYGFELVPTLANYLLLLPLYAFAIRWWTRRDRPLTVDIDIRPRAAWREALVIGLVLGTLAALAAWFALHPRAAAAAPRDLAADPWATLGAYARNAARSLPLHLVPVAIFAAILGLRPRELALAPRYLGLGAALVALGVAFAALGGLVGMPPAQPLFTAPAFALPIFIVQMGINGLPEEILWRGLVMQRLLGRLRSPLVAIVAASALFAMAHIPIQLWQRGDTPVWQILARGLASQPTGLAWAYLCYRTRSVWPGILWHTSVGVLGFLFY